MSGKLFMTMSFTTAVVAALIVMFAGPAAATSITYSEIQAVSSPVMLGSHGQGSMMLAGAKVRDHRNKQGGSVTSDFGYDTRGGGKGKMEGAPPLADHKIHKLWPQPERGGVSVQYRQKRWNIPCYGNSC